MPTYRVFQRKELEIYYFFLNLYNVLLNEFGKKVGFAVILISRKV